MRGLLRIIPLIAMGLFVFGAAQPAKAATPVISSVVWGDPKLGGWVFGDRTVTAVVTADAADYIVTGRIEAGYIGIGGGTPSNIYTATVVNNGDKTYTLSFPITGTAKEGGAVAIGVQDGADGPITSNASSLMMFHNFNLRDESSPQCTGVSETTDFSTIMDFRTVDYTMGCASRGKIHFLNPLDFTSYATMDALRTLGSKLDADTGGQFGLSDDTLEYLRNQNAEVTIYGLPYLSAPDIKYEGATPNGSASGVTYNATTKAVTFTANHFSTYSAIPKVTLTAPAVDVTVSSRSYTVTGTVNDPGATVKIYLNDADQGTITVGSDGSFSKAVTLRTGANTIKVTSSNSIGSGYDVTRTVTASTLAATGISKWFGGMLALAFVLGVTLVAKQEKLA